VHVAAQRLSFEGRNGTILSMRHFQSSYTATCAIARIELEGYIAWSQLLGKTTLGATHMQPGRARRGVKVVGDA
jgi:hypothetical protein